MLFSFSYFSFSFSFSATLPALSCSVAQLGVPAAEQLLDTGAARGDEGRPLVMTHSLGIASSVLQLVQCASFDCSTAAPPARINVTGTALPRLAVTRDSRPVVAFYNPSLPGNNSIAVLVCADPACRRHQTAELANAGLRILEHSTMGLAVASDNSPRVAYCDYNTHSLWVGGCVDANCSGQVLGRADTQLSRIDDPGINLALSSRDMAVVVYRSGLLNNTLLVCHDDLCINATRRDLTAQLNCSTAPALALTSDDRPVLVCASYDRTSYQFVVAVCQDPTCELLQRATTARRDGRPGSYTPVQLHQGNLPVFASVVGDSTAVGQVTVIACLDAGCQQMHQYSNITTNASPMGRLGLVPMPDYGLVAVSFVLSLSAGVAVCPLPMPTS